MGSGQGGACCAWFAGGDCGVGVVVWGIFGVGGWCSMFKVNYYICITMKQINKVSLREYAMKHNPVLNRRGKPMSEGYLYRLIREDIRGINGRELWFRYELTGDKDRILIHLS
jgi:hypothetical protein